MDIKPSASITHAFVRLCNDVGSPYALVCRDAYLRGGLSSLEAVRNCFNPSAYHDSNTFAADYLVHSYISKLDVPLDLRSLEVKCLDSYLETESRNKLQNRKLLQSLPQAAEELIYSIRRKIRAVLGDPEKNGLKFLDYCDWGPGATFSLKSVDSTRDKKILEERISITRRAVPYFLSSVATDYQWFAARTGLLPEGPVWWTPDHFIVVEGERFSTAPKKWNKRRTISIQPTGNLFLQKGLGSFIRRRMKKWGIDLDDQSKNQKLAYNAQLWGYSTLDLEDASNSILVEHYRLFFDEGWVRIFEDLRCHKCRLPDGTWHHLELHSGMGNGYTFEVESLIFWAIAQSVCEISGSNRSSSVYGDDVVVPVEAADRTVEAFVGFGFRINTQKTFLTGRFFESCGKHYFDGDDVTPVYEKKDGDTLDQCIRSYNRLYRWCAAHDRWFGETLNFLELRAHFALMHETERRWKRMRSPRKLRSVRRPASVMPYQALWMPGDGGLITSDLSLLPDPDKNGVWNIRSYTARSVTKLSDGWSMYSDSLKREVRETACYGCVSPRDMIVWGFRTLRFYRWYGA